MARNIWIYGNPDKTALGFPSPGDLEKYIRSDVFNVEDGRYRYTQNKNADVIVLSRDGVAHGHFEISTRTKPTERDRLSYPKVRSVYIVQKSALYTNPVRLSELSLSPKSYGRSITEAEFDAILRVAGDIESVHRCSLPQDLSELEWVLREVKRRIGQSDFRQTLIRAYGSRCAVTDCDVLDVLEAAHIDAYAGVHSNHPGNGLLLRADIHALFDADLIAVDPSTLSIALAKSIEGSSYAALQGRRLAVPKDASARPKAVALQRRWKQFLHTRDSSGGAETPVDA